MNNYHLLKNAYGGVKESYGTSTPYCKTVSKNEPLSSHMCGTVGNYITLLPIKSNGTLMHHLLSFEFTFNSIKVDETKIGGELDETNLCCVFPVTKEALDMLFKNFSNIKKEEKYIDKKYQYIITSIPPVLKETQDQLNTRINTAAMYQKFADDLMKIKPKIVKNNNKFELQYIIDANIPIPDALRPSCINWKNVTTQSVVKSFNDNIVGVKRSDNLTDFTFNNLEGTNGEIINITYMKNGVCLPENIKFTLYNHALSTGKFKVSLGDFKKGTFVIPDSGNYIMYKNVPGVTIV